MRITKKFAGASCIGKQVYQPSDDLFTGENSQIEIEELGVLENSFYRRVGDRSGLISCPKIKKFTLNPIRSELCRKIGRAHV